MLRTKTEDENNHYSHLDSDLNNFFSLFRIKEEDFIFDDINNELEEKIFFIEPKKNILKKKEINNNKRNIKNKNQEKKDFKSLNEVDKSD